MCFFNCITVFLQKQSPSGGDIPAFGLRKKEKSLKISPEALFCDCPLVFVRTHSRRAQRKECMQGKPSSGFPCILSRPPAGDRFCAAKTLAPKSRLWRPHQVVRHKRFAAGKTLAQAEFISAEQF